VNRPPGPTVSVKDVALAAGVSLGTVSNVLNRPDRVRAATKERVEAAMDRLGFVRNESARQLRAGRSRTLGYVMLDAKNPFFTDVAEGIEVTAEQAGLVLFLCNSGNRLDREQAYLAHLQQQRVQGVLVTPVDPASPTLERIARQGTPLVVVDRIGESTELCSVAVEDVLGGRLAVEHLVDRGHTRIAFVGGPDTIGQIRDRLLGARLAWRDAGMGADALVVLPTAAVTVTEGRAVGERLEGMARGRRPTAAFCANDLVAIGLLQSLLLAGIRVPEDVALIGYDDIAFASAAAVPLSSIRQPSHEIGSTAMSLLLQLTIEPDAVPVHVEFQPSLVARASSEAR
jgi:LacI family transcriptional regulator